jgi:serine/threonine-protein kinase
MGATPGTTAMPRTAAVAGAATVGLPRTTAMPGTPGTGAVPRTALVQQPQQPEGRGGMYAVIGFLALIALVVGGLVLFNALAKDKAPSEFKMPDVTGAVLEEGSAVLTEAGLQLNPAQVDPAPPVDWPEGTITRTDPVFDTVVQRGQAVTVFYVPVRTPFALDDLAGKTQQEAIDYLNSKGLVLNSAIVTEDNPDVEAGKVIRTDPPATTQVRQGDVITLVVSAGANQIPVPPISGLSEADARTTLETAGLIVTVTPEASDTVNAGTAIRTDPAVAALVPKGSAITLFVSSGAAPVKVPPVEGLTEAQARTKLTGVGLTPDVTYQNVPAGDPKDGKVITQSIASGTDVAPGTVVKLKVGKAVVPVTTTTVAPTTTTIAPTTTTTTTTTTVAPPAT